MDEETNNTTERWDVDRRPVSAQQRVRNVLRRGYESLPHLAVTDLLHRVPADQIGAESRRGRRRRTWPGKRPVHRDGEPSRLCRLLDLASVGLRWDGRRLSRQAPALAASRCAESPDEGNDGGRRIP